MRLEIDFKTEKIPSVNHTYSMSKYGVYKEKETLQFQRDLARLAQVELLKQKAAFFRDEPLEVVLQFSVKNMRRDLDNMLKPVLDALQGIVFKNDMQVVSLICGKVKTKEAYERVFIAVENQ